MDVSKFDLDLNALMSKDFLDDGDALEFIKSLVHLSIELKVDNHFQAYGPLVKRWFGAYQTISNEGKMNEAALNRIKKSSNILTEVFLRLMQSFNEHEPEYNQEFYHQWSVILSGLNGPRRAKSFCRCVQQFKNLVENLRTATHRCHQLAILAVLIRYTEHVPSNELSKLKERSNMHIIDKFAVLKKKPTVMNQHAFLHEMNAMGHSIISLKATKIICEKMSLNFTTSSNALWIDFNMRDDSITIVAVSPTENTVMCLATVARPKLKERLSEEHELKIRGTWTVLANGDDPIQKKIIICVYLPILDRNAAWKVKVKSIFSFVYDASSFSQSIFSQDTSQVIDQRLRQLAVDVFPDGCNESLYQMNGSDTSLSMTCSQIMKHPITPIAKKQLDDDDLKNSCLHKLYNCKEAATKEWIEKNSVDNSGIESQVISAVPIAQHSFGSHSSGLSFCNDMSVLDHDESESHTSHGSFSSVINEHVKNFIQSDGSSQEGPIEKHKFKTQEEHSVEKDEPLKTVAQVEDSVRNLIGMISPASEEKSYEEGEDTINLQLDKIVWQTASPSSRDSSAENSIQDHPIQHKSTKMLSPVRTSPQIQMEKKDLPHVSYQEFKELPSKPTTAVENTPDTNFDKIAGPNHASLAHNTALLEDIELLAAPISMTLQSCNLPTPQAAVNENDMTGYDQDENFKALSVDHKAANDVELEIYTDGVIYDELGCVFANEDEIDEVWHVYIENNGLDYFESEAFKAANAERQQRSKREILTIHKMLNETFDNNGKSSIKIIMRNARGTSKRKSSDSLVNINKRRAMDHSREGSIYSNRGHTSGCFEQEHPFEQQKDSDDSWADGANADVPCPQNLKSDEKLQIENQKRKDVECKMMPRNPLINYLDDLSKGQKTCEKHQGLLIQLIQELQTTMAPGNRISSKYENLFMKTVQSIKMVCAESRSKAAMILEQAKNG